MEFKEFCKERDRMCERYDSCDSCPIHKLDKAGYFCARKCMNFPDEAERIVSEWSKKHLIVTNADKFKEVFGFGFIITNYGIKVDGMSRGIRAWLQQEYQPPREEETDGQS